MKYRPIVRYQMADNLGNKQTLEISLAKHSDFAVYEMWQGHAPTGLPLSVEDHLPDLPHCLSPEQTDRIETIIKLSGLNLLRRKINRKAFRKLADKRVKA